MRKDVIGEEKEMILNQWDLVSFLEMSWMVKMAVRTFFPCHVPICAQMVGVFAAGHQKFVG